MDIQTHLKSPHLSAATTPWNYLNSFLESKWFPMVKSWYMSFSVWHMSVPRSSRATGLYILIDTVSHSETIFHFSNKMSEQETYWNIYCSKERDGARSDQMHCMQRVRKLCKAQGTGSLAAHCVECQAVHWHRTVTTAHILYISTLQVDTKQKIMLFQAQTTDNRVSYKAVVSNSLAGGSLWLLNPIKKTSCVERIFLLSVREEEGYKTVMACN